MEGRKDDRGQSLQTKRCFRSLALLAAFPVGIACSAADGTSAGTPVCNDGVTRPSWWAYASHCPLPGANYDEVFDATKVRRLDFKIEASVFAQGQADLDSIVSNAGTDDLDGMTQPTWMEATLGYDSQIWTGVGVRWKGHASLVGAWSNHIGKLSMRVGMDELEDVQPELADQRFFGFKGFTLGNAYKDDSFIRDKTAADIFRAAGVPAPRGAFAQVYIDIGNGPFYMGLYTMIEKVEDHMLVSQLGTERGNLYKPWGDAARWPAIADTAVPLSTTSAAEVEAHFEKQTNKATDWSDILAAINVVHSDRTDASAWRARLEAVFDVPAFLKWLAANQTMLDWDAYGLHDPQLLRVREPQQRQALHVAALGLERSPGRPEARRLRAGLRDDERARLRLCQRRQSVAAHPIHSGRQHVPASLQGLLAVRVGFGVRPGGTHGPDAG